MKKTALLAITFLCIFYSKAQTTAMDFTQNDCNGNPHHLFQDLDEGNVVIIEYFMNNCGSCIVAGKKLEALKTDLLAEFPNKIKSYAFGYTNSYSCTTISNWVTSNGFTSIPMNNGANQVAYYGGMGMPTIVVLGGTNHAILGSPYLDFQTSDTTIMGADIRSFFSQLSVKENSKNSKIKLYPNPTNETITLNFTDLENKIKEISIMDVSGRIVYIQKTIKGSELSINTALFEKGNYIVNIQTDSETIQEKINISH